MKTGHWIALIGGSIAALMAFACSSEDNTGGNFTPGKGGGGGSVVGQGGKAGSTNQGGGAGTVGQGGSNQGGAAGEVGQGGAAGEGGAAGQGGNPGNGGTAGTGGSSCDPKTQVQSTECDDCFNAAIKGACAADANACVGDTECKAILECMQACSDATCQDGCISQHPNGTQKLFTYFSCGDVQCHDQCYCPGCRFGSTPACNTCLESKCLADCNACDKNVQCMAMVYCFSYMCPDPNDTICMNNCATQFQEGVTGYNTFGTCYEAQCTTDCQ